MKPADTVLLLQTPAQIDLRWLGQVLAGSGADARVSDLRVTPIGNGLMGSTHRVQYVTPASGPASLVVKLATEDTGRRRQAAALRLYQREVGFYREFAAHSNMRVPACHLAVIDGPGETFTLVLEDFPDARTGDQIIGFDADEARQCVTELASLHAAWWDHEAVTRHDWVLSRDAAWAQRWAPTITAGIERLRGLAGETLSHEQLTLLERFPKALAAFQLCERSHETLLHYDFRCDNLLLPSGGGVVVIDFQTLCRGVGCTDLAYFLHSSMPIEHRRAHERALVEHYWSTLRARGVQHYPLHECWREYRRQTWAGLSTLALAAAVAARTERGDRMLTSWVERLLAAAVDLDAAQFLQ